MLKSLTLICLFFGISNAVLSQKKTVIISGKISNTQETSMEISHTELNFQKKIPIDIQGNFRDTLYLREEACYYFSVGKTYSKFYLKDGNDLQLYLDAKDFHKTIRYEGKGSEINNFAVALGKLKAKLVVDAKEFFVVPLKQFLEKNANNKKAYLSFLKESALNERDNTLMAKVIEADYLLIHNNYDKFNYYHLKEHPVLPADYYEPILKMNIDDEELFFNDKNYRGLVIDNYRLRLKAALDASPSLTNIEFVKNATKDIKSIYIKESIISMLFNNVSNKNPNHYADYEKIMAMLVSKEKKDKLKGRLQTAQNTSSGTKSLGFEYESYDGTKVSLSDLKGKLVYIDIWATWCGPCIKQMPALKELIKEYKGKNIVFVVISVDDQKNIAKWKKMVPVYNVGGTHLISDNALDSEFMKAYGVSLIPRSILIDTDGNVINNLAPKPSDENLKTVLNQLLSSKKAIKQ
jgi:thiol-disulfide isomerase/thioredoxin